MGVSVLVSSVGRRRYVVEELLAAATSADEILVADENPYSPALHVPGATIVRPRAGRSLLTWIAEIRERHNVDAILSLHDFDLVYVARHKEVLDAIGVQFIGPSADVAVTFIDKLALNAHLEREAPDLVVRTVAADQPFVENGKSFVLKDRFGSGSSGLTVVSDNEARREAVIEAAKRVVWTPAAPAPAELVLQEGLAGTEYNLDLFFDWHGRVRGHCLKEKLSMRGGETDSARVIVDSPTEVVSRIGNALSGVGLSGNVDVDFFMSEERIGVIDVNPRFGGGYAFSAYCGYLASSGVLSLVRGTEVEGYLQPSRGAICSKYVSVAGISPGVRG